jgi:hypothetical protein
MQEEDFKEGEWDRRFKYCENVEFRNESGAYRIYDPQESCYVLFNREREDSPIDVSYFKVSQIFYSSSRF